MQQLYTDQLQKLIDALYMENFNHFRDHLHFCEPALSIALNATTRLELTSTRQVGLRPYRLRSDRIYLHSTKRRRIVPVQPRDLMKHLVQASWWPESNQDEAIRWWQECFDFIAHLPALIRLSKTQRDSPLIAGECFAMAADRPFHPFAHAKGELADLIPSVETPTAVIHWWAFQPDRLKAGRSTPPAQLLLTHSELAALNAQLNLLAPGWIALPVLSTQHTLLLSAKDKQDAVNLVFSSSVGQATSSLRTLISANNDRVHLKLSTHARTLGAIRSMPPRYLINGDEAYSLLGEILEQNETLAQSLRLCDERNWWVADNTQGLIKSPGLFGCQVRYLPEPNDTSSRLITLSALSFAHAPVWQQLVGKSIEPWQATKTLVSRFVQTFLTLWTHGVMPECHGQNVLAHYRNDELVDFVLRDHDTLRVYPARLKQRGLHSPNYQIDWSTPNSLVLNSDQELLAYFTTLGIQINLYPIALTALSCGDHSEADFWDWVRQCIEDYADALGDTALRQTLRRALLESETWPFKQILTPLLHQQNASTGMPSAMGEIANPLYPRQANQRAGKARAHEARY